MLRQYSTKGIQNFDLSTSKKDFSSSTTLIGSGENCDIVIKGKNVAERHALIEYHPLTRSYWLRDLGTLGGTTCNGKSLYGMVEMNSADVLQFADSAPYVFELPTVQPSPKKEKWHSQRIGHSRCTDEIPSDPLVLPVVGSKIVPRANEERFMKQFSMSSNKKLCQQRRESELYKNILPEVQDSSSSGQMIKEELSINIRPISSKARIRRSISLHRPSLRDDFKIDRLPRRVFRNDRASFSSMANKQDTPSSGNSSAGEIKEFKYPRLSLTKEENSIESPRTPIGSQLLRRIVRLQDELHRRDLEIEKLKENALLPSNSGERVKHHLDEYRNALAKAQLDNEKLRAILELNAPNMPGEWITQHNEKVKNSETELLVKDLIIQTFFSVCYEQLDELAQNLFNTPMRDYADTFLEIIKSLQDPFSFRLMEINTKCGQIFDKQKFSDSQRQKLYEQFDLFLKGNIHPVSKALDIFFPVLKDAVTIARESVRACTVFSQWSREMGDQVMSDGLNWELLVYKVDDLHIRFRETNLARHWLLPSLVPLFKTLALEHKKYNVEAKERELKQKYDLQQTEEKVSNLIILVEEQKAELAKGQYEIETYQQQNQELKAELQKITQEFEKVSKYEKEIRKLEEENETLRKEKQELEDELTYEMEQLQERLRIASEPIITKIRAKHDSSSSTSGLPRLTKAQSVPKIQLEDRSATPSEVSRGETPNQIHDLIEEHLAHAQPLSPISSVDTEENVESPNLDIEEQVEGDGEVKTRERRSVSEEPENEELHMDAINEPEEIILSTTPEEPSEIPETPEEVHQTSHDDQKQPENPEVSDEILNQQEQEQVQEEPDEDKQVEEISNEIPEEPIDSLETAEHIEKMEQIPENQEETHADKLDKHIELTETPADQLQETPATVFDDQVTTGPKDVPEDTIETPIAQETHVTVQEPSTETVEPHLVMIDCGDNLVVVEKESDAIASAPEDRPAEIVNLDEEAIKESDQLQDSPESPSTQEHESPSALEHESLSAQEHENPSAHDHENPSAQEHESPSTQDHESSLAQDHESSLAQDHDQVGESDTDHSEDEESIKNHGDVEEDEDEAQIKRTSRQVSEDQQIETQSQEATSEHPSVKTIEDIEAPNEPLHEIARAQEIEELSEPQETEKVDKLKETPANVQEPPKVEEAHEPQASKVVEEPPEDTKILNHVEETESPRESNEDVDETGIITNEDKSPSPVETSRIDELEEQLSKNEEDYQHHQVGDSATDHSEDENSDEDFRGAEEGVSSQRVSRQASMDQKPEHHEALHEYKVEPHNESQNGETETPEASEAHLGPQEVPSEAPEAHLEPQEVSSEASEAHLGPQEVPSEASEAHLEPQEVPPEATEAHLEPQEVPPEASEVHLEPQEVSLVPSEASEAHLEPQEVPVEQTLPTPPENIQPLEDLHINGVHMQIRPRKSVSSTDGEKPPLPKRNSKKSEIASKLPRLDINLPQPKKSARRTRSRQNSKDQTSPSKKISSPIDAVIGNHIEVINAPRGEIGRRNRPRSARNKTREGPLPAPRPRRTSEDVLASPTVVKEVHSLDTQQLEPNNIHETEKDLHPSQAEVESQENFENQEKSEPEVTPPVQEDQHMPDHFNIDPRLSIDTVIKPMYDDEISDHEHSMPGSPNVTSEESIHPAETDDESIMSTDRGEGNLNVVNGLGVPLRETMHSRIENREEDEGRPDSDEVENVVNITENEKVDTTTTERPKFDPVQKWHEIDEFWQLVFTLAKMLSLDLPTTLNDPDQDETHRRRNAIDLLLLELENKLNKKRQQSASSKKSSKKNSKTSKTSENEIPKETRIASIGDEDVFFDENDPEVHKAAETIQKHWRKSRLVQR